MLRRFYIKPVWKQIFKTYMIYFLLIFTIGSFIIIQQQNLYKRANLSLLTEETNESDSFRDQRYTEEVLPWLFVFAETNEISPWELMACLMIDTNFDLSGVNIQVYSIDDFQDSRKNKMSVKQEEFEYLAASYQVIWGDLQYFPVPESSDQPEAVVSFENAWMAERTYGGARGHEGTDIMAGVKERDYYPIVSMTSGTVEKIGWLEQGGYRIGIRSEGGAYFYYAHLSSYADGMEEGMIVKAGDILGFMGDSGYGPEGTTGQFDIHLHLGIYISGDDGQEISVNPYWILRYLEDKKLTASYGK